MRYNLQLAQSRVKSHLENFKSEQAIKSKITERQSNLKIGDTVKITNEARQKFDSFYLGPFIIIGQDNMNFTLMKEGSGKMYKVHKNRVLKYVP